MTEREAQDILLGVSKRDQLIATLNGFTEQAIAAFDADVPVNWSVIKYADSNITRYVFAIGPAFKRLSE